MNKIDRLIELCLNGHITLEECRMMVAKLEAEKVKERIKKSLNK